MDFYHELLDSYSKLKKRKLKVSLQETSQSRDTYKTIANKATEGDSAAKKAIQETDAEVLSVFGTTDQPGKIHPNVQPNNAKTVPITQTGSGQPAPTPEPTDGDGPAKPAPAPEKYEWRENPNPNSPFLSKQEDNTWKVNRQEWDYWRNEIARTLYQGQAAGLAAELGLNQDPLVVDFLTSEYGTALIEAFGEENILDFIKMANGFEDLGDLLPEGFLDPNNRNSIFAIAAKSLDPKNKFARKLEGLFPSLQEAVSVQQIVSGVESLRSMLTIVNDIKQGKTPGYDQAKELLDKIVIVKDKKQEKVFFKAEGDEGIGISFIVNSKDPGVDFICKITSSGGMPSIHFI